MTGNYLSHSVVSLRLAKSQEDGCELIGWLALACWLAVWLAGRLPAWLAGWLTGWLADGWLLLAGGVPQLA